MGLKDLEVKSLLSKIKAIEDELLMVDSVHEELLSTFLGEAEELAKEKNLTLKPNDVKVPNENVDDSVTEPNNDVTSDVKKLYRRIVTKTHPDKLIDVEEDVKIKLTLLFEEAVNAFETDDLFGLIKIANELDLPGLEINESHLPLIKRRVGILSEQLEKAKDSTVYVWYTSEDEIKKNILEKYLTFMYS